MSTSNTLPTDFTIRLRDGRTIGVASVGTSDGFPIFHCHGSSSSRLEVNLLVKASTAQGVRLIGPDRPGIGRSDARAGYRLLDWPDDVVEVADRLGIEQFAVEGISAGGPYALACAYKIPRRLTACGLISTVSPGNLIRKAGPGWMRAVPYPTLNLSPAVTAESVGRTLAVNKVALLIRKYADCGGKWK